MDTRLDSTRVERELLRRRRPKPKSFAPGSLRGSSSSSSSFKLTKTDHFLPPSLGRLIGHRPWSVRPFVQCTDFICGLRHHCRRQAKILMCTWRSERPPAESESRPPRNASQLKSHFPNATVGLKHPRFPISHF